MAMAIVIAPSSSSFFLLRVFYHSHPLSANAKPRGLYSRSQIRGL
jgi:hypothetical protein